MPGVMYCAPNIEFAINKENMVHAIRIRPVDFSLSKNSLNKSEL
jgi:hypothetical protein